MSRARYISAAIGILLIVSSCAEEHKPSDGFRVTQRTDGSTVFLAEGDYSVRVTGDSVDVPGRNSLECNATVVIIQVTDGEGKTIFEPASLGDRDRFGVTSGMRFEGRYFNAPNRLGGMQAATQTHVSSGFGLHMIQIPETANYRVWGSSRNNLCKFVFSAERIDKGPS